MHDKSATNRRTDRDYFKNCLDVIRGSQNIVNNSKGQIKILEPFEPNKVDNNVEFINLNYKLYIVRKIFALFL